MDWKKIAPWNWFKEEEGMERRPIPSARISATQDPIAAMRMEMDRLFEDALRSSYLLRGGGLPAPWRGEGGGFPALRPTVDISEGRKAYTVRVELPGIDPDDVSIEIEANHTLIIRAEKRQDREEDEEGVHWVESTYGAAQRILSLPEDADADAVEAKFKNGVLKLRIPKQAARASKTRSIDVQQG